MTIQDQYATNDDIADRVAWPIRELHDDVVRLDADNFARETRGLPLRARLALSVLSRIRHGSLIATLPDGRILFLGGHAAGPAARVTLKNWNLASRAFAAGTIGVAESYIEGDWETPDLTAFLELFVANHAERETVAGGASRIFNLAMRFRHWLNENTQRRARHNIAAHYDLGNAFYEKWLDRGMTYSAALYSSDHQDLESAQRAKYERLARATGLRTGDHVLEIGCGWGGFAEFAASEIGCRVTGLTISREQFDHARRRIHRAGLADKVEIKFQDYREERAPYDRIVSIEMFEAVGERYWTTFFGKLHECLRPGGTAGLQVITINEDAFENYRRQPDFIQRYIFPGGMLPTAEILRSLAGEAGFSAADEFAFAQDYARTLADWRCRFLRSWGDIVPFGFDERFRRLWKFYLCYCEAGFRAEYINVRQIVLNG